MSLPTITPDTRLTAQQAFDIALTKLREQGRASTRQFVGADADSDESMCAYRGANGMKCAVGHLIPDELYELRIEGANAYGALNLLSRVHGNDHPLAGLAPDLLVDLQRAHDRDLLEWGMPSFEQAMKQVALKYGLIYTPPAPKDAVPVGREFV